MKCHAVSLRQVLQNACFVDCDDICVSQVQSDSRAVVPGDVVVAIPGATVDGHDYLRTAIGNGAVAVVTQRRVDE